ncbi:pyridoxamine 5'-phosphate oxidase family protein [Lutibacter citreus]|uniref:pyridoxamine 5'-phosphate oxidase family protein n=1 Tax=Lutibacter citreus TaxID=2138210 RepID=UPI000DBE16B2|nr:pyridoxamine 5'-phosphate oxidase family protein [Lutibacter citreus]
MITNLKKSECLKILNNNYIGHLGYIYKNLPFVIPITYNYDKKNIIIIAYTGEGHKTQALRLNSSVALEIAEIQSIDEWKSILVQGTFEEFKGPDAKYYLHKFSNNVKKLITEKEKKELHFIPQFSDKTHFEAIPIVYHINIQKITGKERKSKKSQKKHLFRESLSL